MRQKPSFHFQAPSPELVAAARVPINIISGHERGDPSARNVVKHLTSVRNCSAYPSPLLNPRVELGRTIDICQADRHAGLDAGSDTCPGTKPADRTAEAASSAEYNLPASKPSIEGGRALPFGNTSDRAKGGGSFRTIYVSGSAAADRCDGMASWLRLVRCWTAGGDDETSSALSRFAREGAGAAEDGIGAVAARIVWCGSGALETIS